MTTQVRLIATLNTEIEQLGEVVAAHFGRHRDAERYPSLLGLGTVLGARILGEFGDDPHRVTDAKARRNYAGTSPDHPRVGQEGLPWRGRRLPCRGVPVRCRCWWRRGNRGGFAGLLT